MHYVCFHYEFEHDPFDPDEECTAGGCPSAAVNPRPERRPENRHPAAEDPERRIGGAARILSTRSNLCRYSTSGAATPLL